MSQRDPYSLLGVEPSASGEEVRQAFLRMMRLVHPDRFDADKQPQEWKDANDLLKAVNEAYSILRDPVRRAALDRQRGQGGGREGPAPRQERAQGAPPKPPATGVSADSAPSHGQALFSELPPGVRARLLERQADRVGSQAWAPTAWAGGYVLATILLSVWFPILAGLATHGRWDQTKSIWIVVVSASVGLLLGVQLDWFIHFYRTPLRPRLYVTPLYLVATEFEAVRWWPIWTIRDLKVTNHLKNGNYQHTSINLKFADSAADFDVAPQARAESLLATLRSHDQTVRKAAAEKNWDYFAANDDFSGVVKDSARTLKPRSRKVGVLSGMAMSLFACGAAAMWNYSLPSKKGPPPADRQLPVATQRDADLRPQAAAAPRKPAPAPVFTQPVVPLPRNGALNRYSSRKAIAPLEIRTRGAEHHYFIKLVDSMTEAPVLTVFVRGGQSANLKVPLGQMKMRYAVGSEWYGERYLFGPETSYAEADSEFEFKVEGDQITGYTVELFLQRNGNLRERELRPDQW